MTQKEQKLIEQIMEEFNFSSVKDYMKSIKWTYGDEECPPSIYKLMKLAERLLTDVCEDPEIIAISTGGFRAEARRNDKGEVETLELLFVIEGWYVEADEVE